MTSTIDSNQREAAARLVKARLARTACLHLDQADVRTAILLQIAGVFRRGDTHPSLSSQVLALITDAKQPLRLTSSPGPFIFYYDPTSPNQQVALNIGSVLLSDDVEARAAAIVHFENISKLGPPALVLKTIQILQEKRAEIVNPVRETLATRCSGAL